MKRHLDEAEIRRIRQQVADGVERQQVARAHGISLETVKQLCGASRPGTQRIEWSNYPTSEASRAYTCDVCGAQIDAGAVYIRAWTSYARRAHMACGQRGAA